MPTNDELDLPPGYPAYAAGPLATTRPRPTAGAFRASGQQDLNRYLAPSPLPPVAGLTANVVSQAQQWADRARTGLLDLFGISPDVPERSLVARQVPPVQPAPVSPARPMVQKVAAQIPGDESPVYKRRLANQTGAR